MRTLEMFAFPAIGDLPVSDVTAPMIRDLLSKIWLEKPETARRVRQRIGVVLDWAYSKGWRETEAPMRSITKGLPAQPKKKRHHAALPYAKVPQFLENLAVQDITASRLALRLLILTASRSGEVRGAEWKEIDVKRKLWTISAERMKAGTEHIVPLSNGTLEVLDIARRYGGQGRDLVFPGQKLNKPLSDMAMVKVMRDMKVPATPHGFRSSFRDWAAEQTSYPGEVAEAALAHAVTNKVEAAYRRTNYLEKRRDLMRDWEQFCLGKA